MLLAVDAAGPGIIAWPVGGDSCAGAPFSAATLAEAVGRAAGGPLLVVVDGAPDAPVHALPIAADGIASIRATDWRADTCVKTLHALAGDGGAILRGVARPIGAFRIMRPRGRGDRPLLVCDCRADGSVAWVHFDGGEFRRFSVSPIGAALRDTLARPELASRQARDEDDDVAYERGLSLAEHAQDLAGDIARATARVVAGDTQGSAAGALLAGVLIGHDCARGLRLGQLGGPLALVGAGLLAERYSVALARFGVAVRRIAPDRALREGCREHIGGESAA